MEKTTKLLIADESQEERRHLRDFLRNEGYRNIEEASNGEEAINKIHTIYNENSFHDWCDTISNDMIVTAALLYGQGDFGRSIGLAVQAAFDTDCNGATVGSILGIMCGKKGIDPAWITPWQEKLNTAILDYNMVTVDELTQWTIEVMNKR